MASLLLMAAFAPLLTSYDPVGVDSAKRLLPPSTEHWFGTDGFGMDVLTRILFGARTDLVLTFAAASLALSIGSLLGATSAYLGGWVDQLVQRATEVIQAFPVVLFAMAVLTALGVTLTHLIAVITIINVPVYVKIVRSVVLPMRSASFVEAARAAGHGKLGIIVRHVLPNTAGPVIAQFPINCAWSIQVIAGLSFLGLGVRIPEPEWGLMVQQGANYVVTGQWWVSFFPGIAIVVGVYAFYLLGERLQTLVGARR
jgi:peptide/nickel transport system permease protein